LATCAATPIDGPSAAGSVFEPARFKRRCTRRSQATQIQKSPAQGRAFLFHP
jgi:hypothetical protein